MEQFLKTTKNQVNFRLCKVQSQPYSYTDNRNNFQGFVNIFSMSFANHLINTD